jgi:hypothetical protein
MAKIPEGAFKDWRNGQTMGAEDWQQEREMLRIQGNDNFDRIQSLELSADNLRLADNFAKPVTAPRDFPLGSSVFKATGTEWNTLFGTTNRAFFVSTNKDVDGNAVQMITSQGGSTKMMYIRQSSAGAWLAPKHIPNTEEIQVTKITSDNGGTKVHITNPDGDFLKELEALGTGFHTFYATGSSLNTPASTSIRGIAHFTTADFGWIYATDYFNHIYTNYYDKSSWLGWKRLITDKETLYMLWEGTLYMDDRHQANPTTKLSDCPKGWLLEWSEYGDGAGRDAGWQYTFVPKRYASRTNAGMWVPLTGLGGVDVRKYMYFSDTTITGAVRNSEAPQNQVVLRRVYSI